MSFHRTLSHVQVPSDLRVVTPLEQQFDDLPFPRSYLCKLFFHDHLHLAEWCASIAASGAKTRPLGTSEFSLCVSFCKQLAKTGCFQVNSA
jgi:hypothetical protein